MAVSRCCSGQCCSGQVAVRGEGLWWWCGCVGWWGVEVCGGGVAVVGGGGFMVCGGDGKQLPSVGAAVNS